MAYSDPGDAVSGAVITEAWGDAVRANVTECALATVQAKGDLAVATAANVIARLAVGADGTRLVADSGAGTGVAWQIQPAARVYISGAFDPTPTAWDSIEFDSERYDTDAMHSVLANTDRLTVPANGDGIYHIGGNAEFDNVGLAGANHAGIRILLNGATIIAQHTIDIDRSLDRALHISCDYDLNATDFVTLQVYTTDNVDIQATANYSAEFWCHFVRAT